MPIGSAGMTLIQNGSVDDGNINIGNIGFDFPFYNSTYRNNIFVGSNSYITFGFGSNQYNNISYINPGAGIFIAASDRSYQRVYVRQESPTSFRIRYEGSSTTFGTPGNPTQVWECTLQANGNIQLDTGQMNAVSGGNFITDGSNNHTDYTLAANKIVTFFRTENNTYDIGQLLNKAIADQIQFHLRQTSHRHQIDYGNSLTKYYTTSEQTRVSEAITRCNTAFDTTPLNAGNLIQESQEITNQNITVTTVRPGSTTTTTYGNRTKTTSKRPSYQQRLSSYYKEVETLARILGVELW